MFGRTRTWAGDLRLLTILYYAGYGVCLVSVSPSWDERLSGKIRRQPANAAGREFSHGAARPEQENMPNRDTVLVANGQGFWGDSILGPVRLVNEGPLDYLTLDYLAEVTMSIMQKLKSRDPEAGYATDFIEMVKRVLPRCREKAHQDHCQRRGGEPSRMSPCAGGDHTRVGHLRSPRGGH